VYEAGVNDGITTFVKTCYSLFFSEEAVGLRFQERKLSGIVALDIGAGFRVFDTSQI
jgi:hypothetical protein